MISLLHFGRKLGLDKWHKVWYYCNSRQTGNW